MPGRDSENESKRRLDGYDGAPADLAWRDAALWIPRVHARPYVLSSGCIRWECLAFAGERSALRRGNSTSGPLNSIGQADIPDSPVWCIRRLGPELG